jgi:hypothetical protein
MKMMRTLSPVLQILLTVNYLPLNSSYTFLSLIHSYLCLLLLSPNKFKWPLHPLSHFLRLLHFLSLPSSLSLLTQRIEAAVPLPRDRRVRVPGLLRSVHVGLQEENDGPGLQVTAHHNTWIRLSPIITTFAHSSGLSTFLWHCHHIFSLHPLTRLSFSSLHHLTLTLPYVISPSLSLADFPDEDLIVLDEDSSGCISAKEFMEFFKDGAYELHTDYVAASSSSLKFP